MFHAEVIGRSTCLRDTGRNASESLAVIDLSKLSSTLNRQLLSCTCVRVVSNRHPTRCGQHWLQKKTAHEDCEGHTHTDPTPLHFHTSIKTNRKHQEEEKQTANAPHGTQSIPREKTTCGCVSARVIKNKWITRNRPRNRSINATKTARVAYQVKKEKKKRAKEEGGTRKKSTHERERAVADTREVVRHRVTAAAAAAAQGPARAETAQAAHGVVRVDVAALQPPQRGALGGGGGKGGRGEGLLVVRWVVFAGAAAPHRTHQAK